MRLRRDRAMDPPARPPSEIKCGSCGWRGTGEQLVEEKDETLDAMQKG